MGNVEAMKEPLFVGYFTPGPYEREAAGLVYSLDALGLKHDIRLVADAGSWQANTSRKPAVLLDFMRRYPLRRLVYLDVDAYVISRPHLFWELDCDFAAHVWDDSETLSGTLFLLSNTRTRAMVKSWLALSERYPLLLPDGRPAWDQRTMRMAIRTAHGLRFERLPHSYCWMIGLSQTDRPQERPIILHKEGAAAWKLKPFWELINGKWRVKP
jgi:hypothetical protein